jgi:hypothetical protein
MYQGLENFRQPLVGRPIPRLDPLASFEEELELLGKFSLIEQERQVVEFVLPR